MLSQSSVSSIDRTRRVFQCVASAKRPLLLREVLEIFATTFISDTDVSVEPIINTHAPEWREWLVREQSAGLLDVIDAHGAKTVQFIHFSVQEYLTSPELRSTASRSRLYGFDT